MHTLLSQHQDQLVIPEHVKNKGTTRGHSHASARDDVLKIILIELDGVPHLGNDELKDARDRAITLELSNRFANVRGKHVPLVVSLDANDTLRPASRGESALGTG